MSLPLWDPRKPLEYPPVYNLFQKVVGAEKGRRRFVETHIAPMAPARILEVGCGPGTNCQWIPRSIEYVGCDLSADYIHYARQRFPGREFHTAPVGQMARMGLKPFDAVITVAVLHHLNDDEVITLCDEVQALLKPGGVFLTGDPCFTDDQSWLSRFVTANDRGRFVRNPDQYEALLSRRFPQVRVVLEQAKLLVIKQPALLMFASKAKC